MRQYDDAAWARTQTFEPGVHGTFHQATSSCEEHVADYEVSIIPDNHLINFFRNFKCTYISANSGSTKGLLINMKPH